MADHRTRTASQHGRHLRRSGKVETTQEIDPPVKPPEPTGPEPIGDLVRGHSPFEKLGSGRNPMLSMGQAADHLFQAAIHGQ
jgi:hypothetical protein